jgi:Methyltransferase domain
MTMSDRLFEKLCRVGNRLGFNFRSVGPGDFVGNIKDVPPEERTATLMHRAFYENTGTIVHKWRGYMQHYDQHLSRYRNLPVRILELGVFKGGSLQMWRRYFGDDAVIFGIDIDPSCKQYDDIAGKVRIGSQDDPNFLMSVVAEMGGIDVVVDDGSHVASHQRASFKILFPVLDPNGVYICEDTHTAYWRGPYEGGYARPTNFIETAKKLIDDIHGEYHNRALSVQDANRTIKGVHFYNSMVVIEKAPQPRSIHLKIS